MQKRQKDSGLAISESTSAVCVVPILPEREDAPNANVILSSSPMSAPIFVLRQRNVLRNLRCSSATCPIREHYGDHEGARRSFPDSFNIVSRTIACARLQQLDPAAGFLATTQEHSACNL